MRPPPAESPVLHGKLVVPRRTFSKKEIVGSNPSANVGR
jgi:hypothetical protein